MVLGVVGGLWTDQAMSASVFRFGARQSSISAG